MKHFEVVRVAIGQCVFMAPVVNVITKDHDNSTIEISRCENHICDHECQLFEKPFKITPRIINSLMIHEKRDFLALISHKKPCNPQSDEDRNPKDGVLDHKAVSNEVCSRKEYHAMAILSLNVRTPQVDFLIEFCNPSQMCSVLNIMNNSGWAEYLKSKWYETLSKQIQEERHNNATILRFPSDFTAEEMDRFAAGLTELNGQLPAIHEEGDPDESVARRRIANVPETVALTRKELNALNPGEWLNDSLINLWNLW